MSVKYFEGYNDAMANSPKVSKDADYKLGYEDGLEDRQRFNVNRERDRLMMKEMHRHAVAHDKELAEFYGQ